MRVQEGDGAVIERHLDPLTAAGALALQECHQDAAQRVQPGPHVDDRDAEPERPVAGLAVHAHQAALRLDRGIVADTTAKRAIIAEAGHLAIDEAREPLGQHLIITETPALHRAGFEILDQYVGVVEQAEHYVAAGLLGEIERYGALVAVDADEVGRRAVDEGWTPGARLVATRRLDLDHVGTVVAQYLRAIGTTEHAAKVDDAHTFQRAGHGGGQSGGRAAAEIRAAAEVDLVGPEPVDPLQRLRDLLQCRLVDRGLAECRRMAVVHGI